MERIKPREGYWDDRGCCPRCGRLMNYKAPVSHSGFYGPGFLMASGHMGHWGFVSDPGRLAHAPELYALRPCGEGYHFMILANYKPEYDPPQPAVQEGPIYSDFDEEVGF